MNPVAVVVPGAIAPALPASAPWSFAQRALFRFGFAFLVLYTLPLPFSYIGLWSVAQAWWAPFRALVPWVSEHVLHTGPITNFTNGSGDTLYDWLRTLCTLVISVAAAGVWTALDRQRLEYRRLHQGLRVYLRYSLASAMVSYGAAKLFGTQFPQTPERLFEPLGEFSPMGLLWTFMGYSPPYSAFTGAAEIVGGLLLFSRRATTLGALLLVAVLSNVVALNFCYDVPVKLFSSQLLLLALVLAAPEVPRLFRVLVLGHAAEARPVEPLFASRRMRIGATVAGALFATYVVGSLLYQDWSFAAERQRDLSSSPAAGFYEVESFERKATATPAPELARAEWKRAAGNGFRYGVQFADGAYLRFNAQNDEETSTMTLTLAGTSSKVELRYSRPDPSHVVLDGEPLRVVLRKTEAPPSVLQSRGFHWVNEFPFNR